MTTLSLPAIAKLPSLPDAAITAALDLLFEPSEGLHALALPAIRAAVPPPLASYDELVDIVRAQLLTLQKQAARSADPAPSAASLAARKTLLGILGAHPRLGAKKVESAQSAAEQAQLHQPYQSSSAAGNKTGSGSEEADRLAKLNAEYEAVFPGLIYVVFVNGRSREAIMENMQARIARGEPATEEVEAIEVC